MGKVIIIEKLQCNLLIFTYSYVYFRT